MSAGKNTLVVNRSVCQQPGGILFCRFWRVTFSRAHLVTLRECRKGGGRSLTSSRHLPHPSMMIRRLAKRQ